MVLGFRCCEIIKFSKDVKTSHTGLRRRVYNEWLLRAAYKIIKIMGFWKVARA